VKRTLAAVILIAACSSSNPGQPTSSPDVSLASPSPSPTPSPQPLQRVEPSLPVPVEETAAAAAGGKLYVMGGFNAAGASLATVYVFDGSSWSAGPRLPLPLDHPSAATLDDHVYIAGGHSNGADSARVFRFDGDRWTELARMHFARGGHALVAAAGKLYAMGGNTAAGNVSAVEAYDPSSNAWTLVGTLPQPRNHVMGFVGGGAACVAGGRSPTTAHVDCLDPGSRTWSRIANLPVATSGGGAADFENGDTIVLGGEDASESRIVDQFVYASPQAWASAGGMLAPRHGFELALFNGRAWACGGGVAPGLHPVATCTSLGDPAASAL
jgi:Kelch motif protein